MVLPIRARLALVCASLVAVLLIGFGSLVYLRLEGDLRASADDELATRAEELVDDPPAGPLITISSTDVGDIVAQIMRRDGTVLASTAGLGPDALLGTAEVAGLRGAWSFERDLPTGGETTVTRFLAAPAGDERVVVVGVAFDDQRETLATLGLELGFALPFAVILAGAVGWMVARAALRPVELMRSEAEAVSDSEPGRRLPVPPTRDELALLGASLNRMLDRLEAAVEQERRLVDDASHELRTPLANLKAELDLALRRARTQPELEQALRSAAVETDRLTRLAEDLLVLARADGGRLPLRPQETDVHRLVRQTVERFGGRATARGVSLEAAVEPGLRARLDGERVGQAIGNLIDNALWQTPPGGSITVRVERRSGVLHISVSDTGPGFPQAFIPHAFQPFSRADAGRSRASGGAGLGLAIVRAVAEAHGGNVRAGNRVEGGAIVEVRIPA